MGRESAPCRVCMKKSKDTIQLESVFVPKPRITYLEGYNICTHLNAMIDDGLPKNICSQCKDELQAAFRFMEKAKETDKKLREKLGSNNRITRSSKRIKQEGKPVNSQLDAETTFEEIKTEFITYTKDPLEDSDAEAGERSEDEIEMNWVDGGKELETAVGGKITGDDDDEDDDKPLKELIKKEKMKPSTKEPAAISLSFDSSDVFNDFPQPDNYSSDEDNTFNDGIFERVSNPATTPEAQIFPQGRYMCKICQKTYFTAEGLKAHIAVHMPKKKKVKRVRGPNKKKAKNKKKASDADEDEDDDIAQDNIENDESKKKDGITTPNEKDTSTTTQDEPGTLETAESDGKKKRKNKAPKPKKMFPCHVCGKHMISASKLRYHMVMHTGEKDYLCTMCPKAYSTIYALKHHMRTHTGERPYECKFCGDKFTRPTTLKSHMRRHTGERPYGCDICGKRFIQHSSMTTHMKLNHMAKTIACPHCDKKYARQTDLNTHLLSHTGDKPFACELCPSRFIRQANLNKHMNQHHSSKNAAAAVVVGSGAAKTAEVVLAASTTIVSSQLAEQSMQQQQNQIQTQTQQALQPNQIQTQLHNQLQIQQQAQSQSLPAATQRRNQKQIQPQNQNRADPTLPRVVDVRSLAKPPVVQSTAARIQVAATPPGSVGNDESNSSSHSNHMLPPMLQQTSQPQHHTHMQQPTQMRPPPQIANNENSIPIGLNIGGIPGGIPTHNMLNSSAAVGSGSREQVVLESVEHVKVYHTPNDNLTNLLGQVIDPERDGRPVDDIIRWNWPSTS